MNETDGLHVTVLELPARWDARDEALAEVDAILEGRVTDLVVMPELALTGYLSPLLDADLTRFGEPLDGPTMSALAALARRHQVHLVGPLVLREGGHTFNAAVLLDRAGELRALYKKRHPWIPERWATAGSERHPVVTIEGTKVTLAICYDLHFLPVEARAELVASDLLVFTSAWVDEEDTRVPLLADLSRTFGIAVANANWSAGVVDLPGQGGSVVLDASGNVLAQVEPGQRAAGARIDVSKSRRRL